MTLESDVHVVSNEVIRDALTESTLIPPSRTGSGDALELRRQMARFSDASNHSSRRIEVDAAMAAVDRGVALAVAAAHAQLRRSTGDSLQDVANACPVTGVAAGLGLIDANDRAVVDQLLADVDRVAAVIGRGDETMKEADDAASRLLMLATAVHGLNPVAVTSLLYQTMDATSELVMRMSEAELSGGTRGPAVRRTVRVATSPAEIDGVRLESGQRVVLEIGDAGLEFGHGPHACPGRELAVALAEAVLSAFAR